MSKILSMIMGLLWVTTAHAATISHDARNGLDGIYIVGNIVDGDAEKFGQIVPQTAGPTVVFLSSNGGALIAGLEIGEAIRAHHYDTVVLTGETCVSACGFIWLAGETRYAAESSSIGFHAAYVGHGADAKETGAGNALVGAYMTKLGFSYEAIWYATSAGPNEVRWLHPSDARRIGVNWVILPDRASRPVAEVAAGSPSPQQAASTTVAYADGRRARLDYEQWYASLVEGPYREGVTYWVTNRSLNPPPSCAQPNMVNAWFRGCETARERFTNIDGRRKTEPNFWWGWNSL